MNLLCFDIASGGVTAALFDAGLEPLRIAETSWKLETDNQGAATLPVAAVEMQVRKVVDQLRIDVVDIICIGSFMHNFLLVDDGGRPLTPVFTWLDRRGEQGVEHVRSRIGSRFHEISGCHYHPMFPIFKLAAMSPHHMRRVVSLKAFLLHRLTARWIEDHGMASASGLFNIRKGSWDSELLALVGLSPESVPAVIAPTEIVGAVTKQGAAEFGLPEGTPVIAGSGDGFLAHAGSDCETSSKVSVTLGTSAVSRQTVPVPVLDASCGTFCYRADENTYLLGCAGSNGGNVFDWGRRVFGSFEDSDSADPPIFIPLLHGERSPDWNPRLTGSWHEVTALHTAADLSRSIVEGVIFNLAHFVEIIHAASGQSIADLVLSGNGFLHPLAAPLLAQVAGIRTRMPAKPGLASLCGAGICGLRALGRPVPELRAGVVQPLTDSGVLARYARYRRLRAAASSA